MEWKRLAGWASGRGAARSVKAPRWTVVETPARIFSPSRPTERKRKRERENGFFSLLVALSTANENLLPLPYLPACLPAFPVTGISRSLLLVLPTRIYGDLPRPTLFVAPFRRREFETADWQLRLSTVDEIWPGPSASLRFHRIPCAQDVLTDVYVE